MALIDLGRGGEAGAQGVTGELFFPFALGEVPTHPGGERRTLGRVPGLLG